MIPDTYNVNRAINDVWRAIDALGGAHSTAEIESGYADAFDLALRDALKAVEALGGVWT